MAAWLIVCGVIIVLLLAGYAAWLWWQVWQQSRNKPQPSPAAVKSIDPVQYQQNREAIYQLACALENDALTLTEACIRMSALASQMGEIERIQSQFQPVIQLAVATAHIPILDNWKALSSQEKKSFDRQRRELEAEHQEAILVLMPELKNYFSKSRFH